MSAQGNALTVCVCVCVGVGVWDMWHMRLHHAAGPVLCMSCVAGQNFTNGFTNDILFGNASLGLGFDCGSCAVL